VCAHVALPDSALINSPSEINVATLTSSYPKMLTERKGCLWRRFPTPQLRQRNDSKICGGHNLCQEQKKNVAIQNVAGQSVAWQAVAVEQTAPQPAYVRAPVCQWSSASAAAAAVLHGTRTQARTIPRWGPCQHVPLAACYQTERFVNHLEP
jgi:hypothetical protein